MRVRAYAASMLASVQQHPNPPHRRPAENACKYRAAPNAGVVLFDSRIFHRADAVECEGLGRRVNCRLPLEVSAPLVPTPSKTNNESMSFAVSPQTGCRCLSLRY